MGAVYEAVDERFETPVALKEILVEITRTADENRRELIRKAFRREAKSLAKARHEAIPFVRDYFSELDRQFLVMELIEGDDLAKLLEKRGAAFRFEEVLPWLEQLLDALDYLHTLDPPLIHRDIKPQNLKLNSRQKIKLLDFGIAKSIDSDAARTITHHTFIGATLNYSPIEQLLRAIDPTFREFIILKHREKAEEVLAQITDARCDLFAVGATFYHLLTNQYPTDVTKRTLDLWEGNDDPLPAPSTLNPEIAPSIDAFLLKAMEVERDRRFSSAAEMQAALKDAVAEIDGPVPDPEKTVGWSETARTGEETVVMNFPELGPETLEAKTEPLIAAGEINFDTARKITSDTSPPVPTAPPIQPPNTLLPEETRPTEPSVEFSDDLSEPEKAALNPTEKFSATETQPERVSEPVFSLFEDNSGEDAPISNRLLWAVPLALIGILLVGGVGAMVWWDGDRPTEPEKPPVNTTAAEQPPKAEPSDEPGFLPTPTPVKTEVRRETKPEVKTEVKQTGPRVRPTGTPKTVPNTTKTPEAAKKPRPTQDPRCVYTNSCQ